MVQGSTRKVKPPRSTFFKGFKGGLPFLLLVAGVAPLVVTPFNQVALDMKDMRVQQVDRKKFEEEIQAKRRPLNIEAEMKRVEDMAVQEYVNKRMAKEHEGTWPPKIPESQKKIPTLQEARKKWKEEF